MSICSIRYGVEFHSSGFSQHLLEFSQRCLQALSTLQISTKTFSVCRERLRQELESSQLAPEEQANYLLRVLLQRPRHRVSELLQALERCSLQHVNALRQTLLSSCSVRSLLYGNLSKTDAGAFASFVSGLVHDGQQEKQEEDELQFHVGLLPVRTTIARSLSRNANEETSAVSCFHELGLDGIRLRALAKLIVRVGAELTFDVLRTQLQLGYVVSFDYFIVDGVLGLVFEVRPRPFRSSHPNACAGAKLGFHSDASRGGIGLLRAVEAAAALPGSLRGGSTPPHRGGVDAPRLCRLQSRVETCAAVARAAGRSSRFICSVVLNAFTERSLMF